MFLVYAISSSLLTRVLGGIIKISTSLLLGTVINTVCC